MLLNKGRPYLYLLGRIRWKLIIVAVIALIMAEVDAWLSATYEFDLPIAIPAFLGTAIVFILAFRTNQAYERWWEARKAWGGILKCSRSWARMVLSLVKSPEGVRDKSNRTIQKQLLDRQIAWNYILAARLRGQVPLEHVSRFFSEEELNLLSRQDNANQVILLLQSHDIQRAEEKGWLQGLHHIEMEKCLKDLEAFQGQTERIKNTHFPVLYDHLILFSIYIFSALLSFAIADDNIVFEVLLSIVISGIFLALEKIASDLQDPFENRPADTPMTSISYEIERMMLQLAGEKEMPEAPEQGKFYIL